MRISYIMMNIENGIIIFFSDCGYKRWLKEYIQQRIAIGMKTVSINTPGRIVLQRREYLQN